MKTKTTYRVYVTRGSERVLVANVSNKREARSVRALWLGIARDIKNEGGTPITVGEVETHEVQR